MTTLVAETSITDIGTDTVSDTDEIRFSFSALSRNFDGWVREGSGGPKLYISCDIGNLPYSAENRKGRRSALILLRAAGSLSTVRLMLTDLHKISLLAAETLSTCDDPKEIVSGTGAALFKLMPLINLTETCLTAQAFRAEG